MPFERMAYVADNAAKDLIAPRRLSMQAVWFDNPDRIYPAPRGALLPEKKINVITDALKLIK